MDGKIASAPPLASRQDTSTALVEGRHERLVEWAAIRAVLFFEPSKRLVLAASNSLLKRAGRHRRQTSGQDPDLGHVQLMCDVPAVHCVTEDHLQ